MDYERFSRGLSPPIRHGRFECMLIYSMSVSADGFIYDRDGDFNWGPLHDDLRDFHLEQVSGLGGYILGRRLYETMRVWDTDPAMRETPEDAAFANVWGLLPKVVFSHTLGSVDSSARLATASVAEEVAATLATTDLGVSIGGSDLASQAIALDLVDDYRMFRYPVIVGGGARYFPAVGSVLPLELVESRVFGTSVVFERYRRIR
jgi:dihydrofolate reductase